MKKAFMTFSLAMLFGLSCSSKVYTHGAAVDAKRSIEGIVSVKGTDIFPTLMLLTSDDTKYKLFGSGEILADLMALRGLKLKVDGKAQTRNVMIYRFDVLSYELMPQAGYKSAHIGRFSKDGFTLVTADGEEYALKLPRGAFEVNDGALVWVLGDELEKGVLEVKRYGRIR